MRIGPPKKSRSLYIVNISNSKLPKINLEGLNES
jgi:hypothetical protein